MSLPISEFSSLKIVARSSVAVASSVPTATATDLCLESFSLLVVLDDEVVDVVVVVPVPSFRCIDRTVPVSSLIYVVI